MMKQKKEKKREKERKMLAFKEKVNEQKGEGEKRKNVSKRMNGVCVHIILNHFVAGAGIGIG